MPTEQLVAQAASGSESAWAGLVDRFSSVVWATARNCGLSSAEARDVSQTAWLRLTEHLSSLREPAAVGGWLITTTRREAIRVHGRLQRHVPVDPMSSFLRLADPAPGVDESIDRIERHRELLAAFGQLGERCRQLLRLLVSEPAISYREIGDVMDMPIGSIGPTRKRCLTQLAGLLPVDAELRAEARP